MALTRKMLVAMGLEADKIDQIIEAHAETVAGLKEEADNYKSDAGKYATTKQELDKLKADIKGKDYDKLKEEFDKFQAEVKAAESKRAKESAYREALKDANLNEKGVEKALKYAEWDKIELDEDGKLKDAKGHVKAVREEWAEYVVKTGQKGAETSTPPQGKGGGSGLTKEEIMKIEDTTERQKQIALNHELFGF